MKKESIRVKCFSVQHEWPSCSSKALISMSMCGNEFLLFSVDAGRVESNGSYK